MKPAAWRSTLILAASLLLAACAEPAAELPVNTRLGGDFTVLDQRGEPFRAVDLQGKVSLLFFGFTHCPDICPATLARTVGAWKGLSSRERRQVNVVFASFDPARDTPEHLREYLAFFDPAVIGLTGTPAQIDELARRFGVVYLQESPDPGAEQEYLFSHSDFVYLLDQQGRVRKLFKSDFDSEELIRDVRSLL